MSPFVFAGTLEFAATSMIKHSIIIADASTIDDALVFGFLFMPSRSAGTRSDDRPGSGLCRTMDTPVRPRW